MKLRELIEVTRCGISVYSEDGLVPMLSYVDGIQCLSNELLCSNVVSIWIGKIGSPLSVTVDIEDDQSK